MSAPMIQPLPPIMTTAEVAQILRCKVDTVERYVHAHELAAIQIGRERRIRAEDLLEFIGNKPTTAKVRRP